MIDPLLRTLGVLVIWLVLMAGWIRLSRWLFAGPLKTTLFFSAFAAVEVWSAFTQDVIAYRWISAAAAIWFLACVVFTIRSWRKGTFKPAFRGRPFKRWPKIERVMWGKVRKEREKDG